MKRFVFLSLFALALFAVGCKENSTNPNDPDPIGGKTDLELTKQGNEFGASISFAGKGYDTEDSIRIASRNNGIAIFKGWVKMRREEVFALDTAFGTASVPWLIKEAVAKAALGDIFDIDTSVPGEFKVSFTGKARFTSEGIQSYPDFNNETKPYTLVRYEDPVGTKYLFQNPDGTTRTRTIVSKSTEDEWPLAFWLVKTIRVEEVVVDNPVYSKVVHITNHKFGYIGMILTFKSGKELVLTVLPWSML